MYKLTLSDSWIKQIERGNESKMPRVEGHTMIAFGDMLISIGGCNPIEDKCTDQVWAYKVLDASEEESIVDSD